MTNLHFPRASSATRIAVGYLLLASAWILMSDRILERALPAESIMQFHTIKGLAFVAVTALLLLALLQKPSEDGAPLTLPRPERPWGLAAIFALACALVVGIGAAGYRNQRSALIKDVYDELDATAQLKVSGITDWLNQRRNDANAFAGNPLVIELVGRWLQTHDAGLEAQLLAVLHQQRLSQGNDNLEILDASGRMLLDDGADLDDTHEQRDAVRAVAEHRDTAFIDLYRDGNTIRVGYVAPIFDARDGSRIVALALVEARPQKDLYPYLLRLSNAGTSGETVLLRRDGNDVLFLNELRNHADSALRLRVPLSDSKLVASQFLNGKRGLIEGVDYRGVAVVAAASSVPGTTWTLVAKLDQAEAFAELNRLTWTMGALLLLVLGATFTLTAFIWQRQRTSAAVLELARINAMETAEAQFGIAFEEVPLGMAILSRNGRFLRVNQRLCNILHHSQTDLLARSFKDLIAPEDLPIGRRLRSNALRGLPADRLIAELRYRGRDPELGWSEVTLAVVRNPNGRVEHFIATLQDISERKQHEEQLRQAAAVFTNTQEGIVITDPQGTIVATNPAVQSITGYSEVDLLFKNMRVLQSGRQSRDFYRAMWAQIRSCGHWQGEIWNRHKNGSVYPEWLTISAIRDSGGEITNYIGTFTDISSQKDFETRIEYLAGHDALTGLPNRSALLSQLDIGINHSRRTRRQGALLVLDLDRFKNVNDCFGHPVGDELLKAVAQRIQAQLRSNDALFRLGGDEFGVLVEDLACAEEAASLAQALIDTIARPPFELPGEREACVGASIGIAVFPTDSQDAHALLQHADTALYRAKDSGRGAYRYYTMELTQLATGRLQMEAMLRRALDRREFRLHYQPLVSLPEGRIVGVEALIRWQHPVKGLIPPDQFIPLAEQTGLIVPLGDWILHEACSQMQSWRQAGSPLQFVAVNLSPRQFHVNDLDRRIAALLELTELPATCLELEITEGALMAEDGETLHKLTALKRLGLRLSIDDFGTGYSSLAYLRRFPIDKLKIDRSFVRDLPEDPAAVEIASAIISMGRSLNLDVLAEGVETAAQREYLQSHGCSYGQGYLFSRALPPKELEGLFDDGLQPLEEANHGSGPGSPVREPALAAGTP